jgi:HK97 family phage portal protein
MIRTLLSSLLTRLAIWFTPPGIKPGSLAGTFPPFPKPWRPPTPTELLAELKSTAWTCATLNAAACASFPPRLYVTSRSGQPAPRCLTRALLGNEERRLRGLSHLAVPARTADRIEEVTEHPLLELLQKCNPVHNAFDVWELTTLSQEVLGVAYWLLELGPLGVPTGIWPLPAHQVTPRRSPDSPRLVDAYVFQAAGHEERFSPERIIAFRYPDPHAPYTAGLSPLRACFEQARLLSDLTSFRRQKFENHAIPDAVVCSDQLLGEEERDRLEKQWNERFGQGGAGRVVIAESSLRVQLLTHSMGDLAALADLRATREDVANAFHVPLSFLTTETNLANLQAAQEQHARQAILPRLRRRDEKLNEQLIPLYDSTGRLFLASDDPVAANREENLRERELALKYGVLTINEARSDQGLPPVPWGDAIWLPDNWRQVSTATTDDPQE